MDHQLYASGTHWIYSGTSNPEINKRTIFQHMTKLTVRHVCSMNINIRPWISSVCSHPLLAIWQGFYWANQNGCTNTLHIRCVCKAGHSLSWLHMLSCMIYCPPDLAWHIKITLYIDLSYLFVFVCLPVWVFQHLADPYRIIGPDNSYIRLTHMIVWTEISGLCLWTY